MEEASLSNTTRAKKFCRDALLHQQHSSDRGTHWAGFRRALTNQMIQASKEIESKRHAIAFSVDDVREGLVAVLSVKMTDPKFSSQIKEVGARPMATNNNTSKNKHFPNTSGEEGKGSENIPFLVTVLPLFLAARLHTTILLARLTTTT